MRGNSSNTASNIDGKTTKEDISNHFQQIYSDLYNSVPSDQKLHDISTKINEKIDVDSLHDIDKIDANLIKEAIDNLKPGY